MTKGRDKLDEQSIKIMKQESDCIHKMLERNDLLLRTYGLGITSLAMAFLYFFSTAQTIEAHQLQYPWLFGLLGVLLSFALIAYCVWAATKFPRMVLHAVELRYNLKDIRNRRIAKVIPEGVKDKGLEPPRSDALLFSFFLIFISIPVLLLGGFIRFNLYLIWPWEEKVEGFIRFFFWSLFCILLLFGGYSFLQRWVSEGCCILLEAITQGHYKARKPFVNFWLAVANRQRRIISRLAFWILVISWNIFAFVIAWVYAWPRSPVIWAINPMMPFVYYFVYLGICLLVWKRARRAFRMRPRALIDTKADAIDIPNLLGDTSRQETG